MQQSTIRYIETTELIGLPNNPRTITKQQLNHLMDSIRANGFWKHRPLAVERQEWTDKLVVLDGNQRLKAARLLKMKSVPIMEYSELTDNERTDLILRSNINNGEWDTGLLQSDFDGIDLADLGLQIDLPELQVADPLQPTPQEEPQPDQPEEAATENEDETLDRFLFCQRLMGDFVYPSDNEWGIPVLLMENQPVHVELPINPWGAESRYKKMMTCYHFYVDDYRFEALFKDPMPLLMSGCKQIVEPNCSIHDNTPAPFALWQIYRKRFLARYLQECGLQVFADLNVSHRFAEFNRLGIPDGYNAFFTRGVTGWIPNLELNLQMAQRISGLDRPNLCVYGGGKDVEEWCHKHQLAYIGEFISARKKNV